MKLSGEQSRDRSSSTARPTPTTDPGLSMFRTPAVISLVLGVQEKYGLTAYPIEEGLWFHPSQVCVGEESR